MSLATSPPTHAREDTSVASPSDTRFRWGAPSVLAGDLSPSLLVALFAAVGAAVIGAGASLGLPAGLAALVAVSSCLAVLLRPALGGLALVCLVPLLSGVQRGLPVPGVKLSELVVAGAAGLVLLTCGQRGRARLGVLDGSLLVYVLATAGLGLYDLHLIGESLTVDTATKLLAPMQFLLLFRAVQLSLSTPDLRRLALKCVLYLSLVMSAIALSQQVAGLTVNPVLQALTGSDRVLKGNSTGLFGGKHDLAGYMLLIVLLSTGLLLTPSQRVLGRWQLRTVLVLASLSLVCSVALAAVAGAVLGVGLMAHRRRRLVPVLAGMSAVAAAALVLFGPTVIALGENQFTSQPVITSNTSAPPWLPHGVAYRMAVWQDQYLPALAPHLLTGYGPTLPPDVSWEFTESAYLSLLLRGGIPLLLIFLAVNVALYLRARAVERDIDPTQRALGLMMRSLVPVLLLINATNPYILNAGLSHLFWILAGLLLVRPTMRSGDVGHRGWAQGARHAGRPHSRRRPAQTDRSRDPSALAPS